MMSLIPVLRSSLLSLIVPLPDSSCCLSSCQLTVASHSYLFISSGGDYFFFLFLKRFFSYLFFRGCIAWGALCVKLLLFPCYWSTLLFSTVANCYCGRQGIDSWVLDNLSARNANWRIFQRIPYEEEQITSISIHKMLC